MRSRRSVLLILLPSALLGAAIGLLDHRRRSLANELAKTSALPSAPALSRNTDKNIAADQSSGDRPPTNLPDMLVQAHEEIVLLEQRARVRRAEMIAASRQRVLDANCVPDASDPTQGMTKLERFQNVGRATPSATFQTLVWAAIQGEQQTLEDGLALDESALRRAQELIAALPEEARTKTSPVHIAALWFQQSVLDIPTAQIVGEETQDGTGATLLTRGGIADSSRLNFVQSGTGWQLIVPQHGLEALQKQVAGAPAASRHP